MGGGHSHVEVLRRLARRPEPRARLTLLADREVALYSGMVPGFVAGQYAQSELTLDLRRLAERAGARLLLDRVVGLDPRARRLRLAGAPDLPYDLASLDVGSTVAGADLPGVREHALATRPMAQLVAGVEGILARGRGAAPGAPFRVAVVGAGAGGVELAFAFRARLLALGVAGAEVLLLEAAPGLLPGAPRALARRVARAAARRGLLFRGGASVRAVTAGEIALEGGGRVPFDALVWAAGAAAHPFLQASGLPVDPRGYVLVAPTLEVPGCPGLFAAGDCAQLEGAPATPRAGVHAVRAGPVLAGNLRARLRGRPLRAWRPQRDFLTLLNLGDGTAIGCKWSLVAEGRLVLALKDWIDRRFVGRYRSGPPTASS